MDSVRQSLIPTLRSTIPVHHFRHRQVDLMAEKLSGANPVGLSIRLSSTGVLDFLALATSNEVCLLKFEAGKLPLSELNLSSILDGFTLVAFEMAQLALHIHRCLQQHVRGVDLSTLLSSSTKQPWRPSKFVEIKLCYDCRKLEIDQLWDGDSEYGFREVCLRAWLSARSVFTYTYGRPLDVSQFQVWRNVAFWMRGVH